MGNSSYILHRSIVNRITWSFQKTQNPKKMQQQHGGVWSLVLEHPELPVFRHWAPKKLGGKNLLDSTKFTTGLMNFKTCSQEGGKLVDMNPDQGYPSYNQTIMNIKYSWKHESSKALLLFFVWSLWKNLLYLLDMYTNFCFCLFGRLSTRRSEDPRRSPGTPKFPQAAWRIPWKMSSLRILQDDTEAILRCLEVPLLINSL